MTPCSIVAAALLVCCAAYTVIALFRLRRLAKLIGGANRYRQTSIQGHAHVRLFGDSVAKGVGASGHQFTLCGRLQHAFANKDVDCRAQVGQPMKGLGKLLAANSFTQDTSVVYSGGFDVVHKTPRQYEQHALTVVDALAHASDRVVVFIPSNAGKITFFPLPVRYVLRRRSQKLEEALFSAAGKYDNVVTINLMDAGGRDLSIFDAKYLAEDAIHPNDLSYEVWFRQLLDVME